MKLCDNEVEMSVDTNPNQQVFDLNNPEGAYSLKLEKQYDRIVLQNLLDLSFELSSQSEDHPNGAFE